MAGQVQERIDLGDRHLLGPTGELDDRVTRFDVSLFEHAEVEAGAVVRNEQRRDARIVHADSDAVARDARLRDFEDGGPDLVAVADADLVVAQSVDGEVLAELAVDEVAPSELAFPVAVGVELVDEDGAVLAPVAGEIALAVGLDVELAHVSWANDGILVDAGKDGLPLPGHVPRQADVDRQQSADRRAHAYASAETASSASWMPPISSTVRLRSGPCGRTF